MAETRLLSLKEKCGRCSHIVHTPPQSDVRSWIGRLQAQVARLREDLDMQRIHRQELSEELLSEARERLQQLQQVVSHSLHTTALA